MAAPGIVLFYDHSYHNRSVYLHDITAHDFGGIYRASGESSCNEGMEGLPLAGSGGFPWAFA